MRVLSNLRIRTKLWLGFGVWLVIWLVVAVNVFLSLTRVSGDTAHVVNEIQPAVFDAMELADELDASSKALGFYLLSKEPQHKKDYLNSLQKIDSLLEQLQASSIAGKDQVVAEQLKKLSGEISRFEGFREQMLKLSEKPQEWEYQ